jgi:hypothetical protein
MAWWQRAHRPSHRRRPHSDGTPNSLHC